MLVFQLKALSNRVVILHFYGVKPIKTSFLSMVFDELLGNTDTKQVGITLQDIIVATFGSLTSTILLCYQILVLQTIQLAL